jgi:hypothetical protein
VPFPRDPVFVDVGGLIGQVHFRCSSQTERPVIFVGAGGTGFVKNYRGGDLTANTEKEVPSSYRVLIQNA